MSFLSLASETGELSSLAGIPQHLSQGHRLRVASTKITDVLMTGMQIINCIFDDNSNSFDDADNDDGKDAAEMGEVKRSGWTVD